MRRILIATDDSPSSRKAIKQGADLLGPGVCTVRVLSVIAPQPNANAPGQLYHRAAETAQDALDLAIKDLAAAGHCADGFIKVGEPADTIVSAAREFNADLIVVGTRGPRVGSVAENVLRMAPCGVLVYPLESGEYNS